MIIFRRIVVCLLLSAVPHAAAGQESPLSLGLLAGAVVADQTGADVFAPHDRIGLLGGAFVRLETSSAVAFQLEGLYVPKGGRENNDQDPGDLDDELDLEYLEVPLLLKVALSGQGVRPELFAGPSVSFRLGCTYDAFPEGASAPEDCELAGIETKSVELGFAFGADVDIPVGSGAFVIDARGIVGLDSLDDSAAELDYRNRFLSLMLGYRFTL